MILIVFWLLHIASHVSRRQLTWATINKRTSFSSMTIGLSSAIWKTESESVNEYHEPRRKLLPWWTDTQNSFHHSESHPNFPYRSSKAQWFRAWTYRWRRERVVQTVNYCLWWLGSITLSWEALADRNSNVYGAGDGGNGMGRAVSVLVRVWVRRYWERQVMRFYVFTLHLTLAQLETTLIPVWGIKSCCRLGFLWEKEIRMLFLYVSSAGCRLSPTINNCISGSHIQRLLTTLGMLTVQL